MRRFAPGWEHPRRQRRRPRTRLVVLLVLVPLFGGLFVAPSAPVPSVAADELDDAIANRKAAEKEIADRKAAVAELNAMQAALKADIAATTQALREVNADLAAVRKQISAMEVRITKVQAAYEGLVAKLRVLIVQISVIKATEDITATKLAERRALLADRIRDAYATDRTSMLETFLSGESFADILTEVGYFIDVGEQDKALAEQITRDQEILAAIHATLDATQRETEALRVETARQKVELDKQLGDLETARAQLKVLERQTARALASQKAAYAKMAKNKASAQKALDQAAAAQRQLQAQIDRLIRERTQFGNIPSRYNGTLIWPMAGNVTQNFGCTGFSWEPPLGSCEHFHKGIDLAAPMYEPIRAAGDGVVVFSGFNPYDPVPKAYIIIIAHSDELLTWYAHLDASVKPARVRAGDTVKQGEVIGYEGTTGRSTGPHLHWAVEYQNEFVNPRLFV
jgi:murein DD-endopeptidase MepM/ murein hydrolase activator NlpD